MVDTGSRRWQLAWGLCLAAIVLSIRYIDRPVAEFMNIHVRPTDLWDYLNDLLSLCALVAAAGLLVLLASGCALLSGRVLPRWSLTPILCSWSLMWALGAEVVLKGAFGRGTTTTYVQNHIYQFHYLHDREGWNSFPSGTATVAAAIAAVLWRTTPSSRVFGVVSVAIVAVLLVLTNGHWVSDVIAGGFLGASIGDMTYLMQRPKDTASDGTHPQL